MEHVNDRIARLPKEEQESLNQEALRKVHDPVFYEKNNIEYNGKPTMNNFFQVKRALFYEMFEQDKTA